MLDAAMRRVIDPPLNLVAAVLCRLGVSANGITLGGFAIGMAALPLLALDQHLLALCAIGLNRLADGLDGAVARKSPGGATELGGYLDITLDFLFYGAVVLGFAIADPAVNGLPAAVLLFGFIGTGSSFLAYAIIAAKQGISTEAQGKKGIYYLAGLTEGTETIAFFVLICLIPEFFAPLALGFAALCLITTFWRILAGVRQFSGVEAKPASDQS